MTLSIIISAQVVEEVELRPDGIVIPRLETSSVVSPTEGQVVYQSSDDTIYFFDGTDWLPIGAGGCLLYTSPSPRDRTRSRMPSSA